jgi:hypothetical protein
VAIYRLLRGEAFGPHEIGVMTCAYEDVLRALKLSNRSDPVTREIAKQIIECAKQGERDPRRLRDRVLRLLQE